MRQTVLDLGKKRARERGGILVIAIIVILAMLILAIPFLFKLSAENRSTERAARALSALNLAEAGVDKVMWELDPYHSPSTTDTEAIVWDFSGINAVGLISGLKTHDSQVMGNVQVVLTPPVGVAPNPQRRNLEATGLIPFIAANTVDRSVRVTLERYYSSIFDVGFFVDEYFYIHNSFFLDAYNSKDGAYGASLAGGGTNSLLPDVFFGSNSYIDSTHPNDPGEATWVIDAGGGSSEVYGTIMAGGDAAEAHNNDPTLPPPDPSLIDSVISVPNEDIFLGTEDRLVMSQDYELPPVDVYNLPPKEILGSIPSVGDWFDGYNATTPEESGGYYADRLTRAPLQTEIETSYVQNTFTGSGTLTPAQSGVYTSFMIGGYQTAGTLDISGGDVVIYISSYGDIAEAGNFYMGRNSSINIAPDSSLTLILGNTSFTVEQGYNINSQGDPAQAANCVVLGTDQFTIPPTQDVNKLPNSADKVDELRIPGLMYFEHGQGTEDGNIYSAMYVPGAHITTGQGANHMDFYGALISKSMDFKVQVDFHYDKALADLMIQTGGYELWKIINWAEVVGGN
jgi:hypothetical protein